MVIREGDEGDYYYVVESGRFQVERLVGGAKVVLAELKSEAFGEEALVSEAKRNATVTCSAKASLRLERKDFDELLREPLLRRVRSPRRPRRRPRRAVAGCALSVGVPVRQARRDQRALAEVRNMFAVLDRSKEYVAYCQSGRRSAAAAFLSPSGASRCGLEGGLRTVEKGA